MPLNTTPQLPLASERILTVADGDYPEVAREVVDHFLTRLHAFSDELHEFLEQREAAAPTIVTSTRILHSAMDSHVRRWVKHWVK